MRILIDDGFQIDIGTGIGKYSKMLLEDLRSDKSVDVKLADYSNINNINNIIKRLKYIIKINSVNRNKENKISDVVHYTNYVVPFKKNKYGINVVTIHDLVCYKFPKTLPMFYRIYNQIMIKNSMKNADLIITVSDTIKKEIEELFPEYANKIQVVYIGNQNHVYRLNSEELKNLNINSNIEKLINEKFFLFVGTLEKRKNVDYLVDTFIEAKGIYEELKDFKLVLAGKPGYGFEQIKHKIEESRFSEDIIVTGYITDSELLYLYNTTNAYIFPTKYEGFGIPQIECMACETPIILSDIPTNREISEEYGEYFSLEDKLQLIDKMLLFANNKYDYEMKRKISKDRLILFNREVLLDRMINLYKDVLEKKGRTYE